MAYCSIDDIRPYLMKSVPQFIADMHPGAKPDELWSSWEHVLSTWMGEVASDVDSAVGNDYPFAYCEGTRRFPVRGSSPDTPGSIVDAAVLLMRARLVSLTPVNRTDGANPEKEAREAGEKIIRDIREGRRIISMNSVPSSRSASRISRNNVFTPDNFSSWGIG